MRPVPFRPISQLLTAGTWIMLACNALSLGLLPFILAWRYSANAKFPKFLAWPTAVVTSARADYVVALLVFFPCGLCTFTALWQVRRVLQGMASGATFSWQNALCARRVAVCCFIISGLTGARLVFHLASYPLSHVIWYYNTMFVPFFAATGLFFLMLAEVFRQASELREDNSLVI